jgi:hypothetical protein
MSINTFASLSGFTFNIEQAVLTEYVIWNGPGWAARVLGGNCDGELDGEVDDVEGRMQRYGPWKGSKEDGARIAANGLARLLWKERGRKVEEERERVRVMREMVVRSGEETGKDVVAVQVSTLQVSPVVWRGSAGDM